MANIGLLDRIIRIVIGAVLVVLGTQSSGGLMMWILFFLGTLLLITGLFGFCIFYSIFGTSTKRYKVERISKRDIQKAVEQYKVEPETSSSLNVKIQPETKVSSKKTTKKAVKKSTKKAVKKAVSKKTTKKAVKKSTKKAVKKVASKKTTKKAVKKTPSKKVTKKTTKKSVNRN